MNEDLKDAGCEDLARSGLTLEDVTGLEVLGPDAMQPVPGDDLADLQGPPDGYDPDDDDDEDVAPANVEAAGGYRIPYLDLDGAPVRDKARPKDKGRNFSRIRLVGRINDDVPRYRSPKGSTNHVYVPQSLKALLEQINTRRANFAGHDVLHITEGEKKAIRTVKAGMPCIALPGVTMWSDIVKVRTMKREYAAMGGNPKDLVMSENTPVNPELLETIAQIKAICPSIGVVSITFDSDGKPLHEKAAFTKIKSGLVPNGGVDWEHCDGPGGADAFVSANPQVTHAGYTMAAAVRKQLTIRAVVTAGFCEWDKTNADDWRKQGLDDWLQAEPYPGMVDKRLKDGLESAFRLWDVVKDEPLFHCNTDPDAMGAKGGPSLEVAFTLMLDGAVVGKADGLLYEWVGSHWHVIPRLRLEEATWRVTKAFYAEAGGARKVGDAPKLAVAADHLYPIPPAIKWEERGGAVIPCEDVTLYVSPAGEVTARKPRKKDGLRYCIGVRWEDAKDAEAHEFNRFMKAVLPEVDVAQLVQRYIGYTLIGDTRFQVAQCWFGSGANGKGFLARIVSALHRKVAAADLSDLGGFGAENLIDASLITVDEMPKRIDEQRLKTAISGDDLNINRKYHVPVTVQLSAKWLIRGNDKPALSDQTDGIWRRLHIIEFKQKFEGDNRDDLLAERIVENELPGVLRWALEGLVALLKANGFKYIPESVQASKREMQIETDNVMGWWTEKDVQVCDVPRISKDDVYRAYALWCKDNGMMPLGSPRFWVRLKAMIKQGGGAGLMESQVRETVNDMLTGKSETLRVRKVNLDIGGGARDAEGPTATVIPLPSQGAPSKAFGADLGAAILRVQNNGAPMEGYADLDDGNLDDDYSDVPF